MPGSILRLRLLGWRDVGLSKMKPRSWSPTQGSFTKLQVSSLFYSTLKILLVMDRLILWITPESSDDNCYTFHHTTALILWNNEAQSTPVWELDRMDRSVRLHPSQCTLWNWGTNNCSRSNRPHRSHGRPYGWFWLTKQPKTSETGIL